MPKFIHQLLLAAALLSPFAVMADNGYVRLGVGHSTFDYPAGIPEDHPTGFLIAYGMPLDATWGVEGGLVDFGRIDLGSVAMTTRALYAAGSASYPLNPQAAVYGKLGLAVKHFSIPGDSVTRTNLLLGVGARWMFNREWGASIEYAHYGTNEGLALSQTAISAIYHF